MDSTETLLLPVTKNKEDASDSDQVRDQDRKGKMLFLKISMALLLSIIPFALTATLISTHHTNYVTNPNQFQPRVGAYLKNYAGKVITDFGQGEVLTLPPLKVEDHIWEGKYLALECWSGTHPVYWEYKGLGAPNVRVTTVRNALDFYNPSTYQYGAIVTFSSTNYRQTGEYTCRPVDTPGGVSLYVFAPGKKLFIARDEDGPGSLRISADDDSQWVNIPCALSQQNASVQLYSVDKNEPQKIELGSGVEYDALEGFRLKWKGVGAQNSPWGTYMCVASSEKIAEEKLIIKLTAPNSSINRFSSSSTTTTAATRTQVAINYNQAQKRIECCASRGNIRVRRGRKKRQASLPRMKLSSCVSVSDCFFSSAQMASFSSHCATSDCDSDSFVKKLNDTCVAYELPEVQESGVLDCSVGGDPDKKGSRDHLEAQLQFVYDPLMGLVTNFETEEAPTSKILGIGRDTSPNSSLATYFCSPNPFFFSTGIKWALQATSDPDSLQFLNNEDSRATLKVDEAKVTAVYCFAPIWDSSTEWRNVSMLVPNRI